MLQQRIIFGAHPFLHSHFTGVHFFCKHIKQKISLLSRKLHRCVHPLNYLFYSQLADLFSTYIFQWCRGILQVHQKAQIDPRVENTVPSFIKSQRWARPFPTLSSIQTSEKLPIGSSFPKALSSHRQGWPVDFMQYPLPREQHHLARKFNAGGQLTLPVRTLTMWPPTDHL